MFKSILVPLDGSTFAEHALPLAAAIAKQSGATLRLVRVLPHLANQNPLEALAGVGLEKDPRATAQAYLQQVSNRVEAATGVLAECNLIVAETTVTDAIRTELATRASDLVVLTSHGRGAVSRLWLGSVADELVRSLRIPILLIRPQENGTPNLAVEAKLGRVLLALDARSNADSILQPALTLGHVLNSEFILMHVLAPPVSAEYTAFTSSPDCTALAPSLEIVEAAEMQRTSSQEYLEQLAQRIRKQGSAVKVQVRTGEQPAIAILAEAECGVDLIALETHDRSSLTRLFMGSVIDKVIRGSTHPILLCRGPDGTT